MSTHKPQANPPISPEKIPPGTNRAPVPPIQTNLTSSVDGRLALIQEGRKALDKKADCEVLSQASDEREAQLDLDKLLSDETLRAARAADRAQVSSMIRSNYESRGLTLRDRLRSLSEKLPRTRG